MLSGLDSPALEAGPVVLTVSLCFIGKENKYVTKQYSEKSVILATNTVQRKSQHNNQPKTSFISAI